MKTNLGYVKYCREIKNSADCPVFATFGELSLHTIFSYILFSIKIEFNLKIPECIQLLGVILRLLLLWHRGITCQTLCIDSEMNSISTHHSTLHKGYRKGGETDQKRQKWSNSLA